VAAFQEYRDTNDIEAGGQGLDARSTLAFDIRQPLQAKDPNRASRHDEQDQARRVSLFRTPAIGQALPHDCQSKTYIE
jgi:hypothetical protein